MCVKYKVRVLVDTNEITWFKGSVVDETDERQEDGLAGGGFDDGGFAYSGRVKIDVCALFCGFFLDVEIE